MLNIRDYRPEDGPALTAVHNTLLPEKPHTHHSWQQHMADVQQHGRAWVLWIDDEIVGYTAVLPVPGLPGLVEMEGGILPPRQRQGWGSRLLQQLYADLADSGVRQLSYAVPSLDTPAALFLQKHNFFIEHEEWVLTLEPIDNYQLTIVNYQLSIATHPRGEAIPLFSQLYTAAFSNTPWNQPYSEAEVADLLEESDDILFLVEEDIPVGFVWVRQQSDTAVTLEPIGISKEKQGRGYGRWLLQTLLTQLASEGVTAVTLGVWADNHTAVHLYKSLGFTRTGTLIYLAYDIA
jgi:ribosomal protein S18 acetylase RimI-like enzyme